MTTQKFSKSEAIRFGWNTMKSNLRFFIGLLIVTGLVYIVPDVISELLTKENLPLTLSIIGAVLDMIVSLGLIKISLNFCDNLKSQITDIFSQYSLFFKYLFASILYGLIIVLGFIFLIIPGIYLTIRLQFYGYFIVDRRSGIIESLKRSWTITWGNVLNLFLFGLLLVLINLLGVLLLLVGLFASVPTTMVAMAFVYRKLLAQLEIAQVPESSTEEIN